MDLANWINQYGFPIVAAVGMGYIIYNVWVWTTVTAKPILEEAYTVLVKLIDKIRLLDDDLIRIKSKIQTALVIRNNNGTER